MTPINELLDQEETRCYVYAHNKYMDLGAESSGRGRLAA